MDTTTLTIIGMIAAFFTASVTPILTDTVKKKIEHKNKIQNLRRMLYVELLHNYDAISAGTPYDPYFASRHVVRTECYKSALQNELSIFYQLPEAGAINLIEVGLAQIVHISESEAMKKENTERPVEEIYDEGIRMFLKSFETACYGGLLDKKIFLQLISRDGYDEIAEKGKKKWDEIQKKINS